MDLTLTVTGDDGSTEYPHLHNNRHHFAFEPLELEPRQLLSVVQATTPSGALAIPAFGATGGLAGTAADVGAAATSSSVQTLTAGGVSALPSQVPVNDLVANLGPFTANVGVAAVAVGGFRLVHRGTDHRRGMLVQGPADADGGESRRAGGPPSNN